ncbi:MAG: hypothetical protein LBJ72_07195 [Dysgonamonadaceae bacterium]|jgi:hypothetical protein|nr:hypothetical protein [Dysgonamonadaceae bacterium]
MKYKIAGIILTVLLTASCASIPGETVTLSRAIGTDLQVLRGSHCNIVQMYYGKIKTDISTFIDEVYAPYVVHHVLQAELDKHKNGESSLYGIIDTAGKTRGRHEMEEALNVVMEFQEAANAQITAKRNELLQPVLIQEREVLNAIDLSYQNIIYANSTLTTYLTYLRKVGESQREVLSATALEGLDISVTDKLVKLSELVDTALKQGDRIDVKADAAYQQIEEIINKIKEITNNIKNERQ